MGYQVTARKWRPQTFDDVVEQSHVTRTLKNAIRLGRIAHAYLFAGTRGVGKTTLARVLAKALNCDSGPTEHPCNSCQSCLEITQGASLDIIEIDGASNRGIDEIRDLRERVRYLPTRGRYKVYIIDEIHMLTKEAFNALLKTLEEPPAHVVFVFATTELEKIPYTIISRCQRFEFKRVSLTGIVGQLDAIVRHEGITVSPGSLSRIAKAAEGSMRDAQSLLDQVVAYCGTEIQDDDVGRMLGHVGSEALAQCLSAIFQQDAETALQTANLLQSEGHEAAGITRALLESLRHLIVLKTTAQAAHLIPLPEADLATLRAVAKKASVEEIYGHFHVLSAAENTLRHAHNPFLVLEMALVRMACIGRVQPLQTILEQLKHLGNGAAAPQPASIPHNVPPVPHVTNGSTPAWEKPATLPQKKETVSTTVVEALPDPTQHDTPPPPQKKETVSTTVVEALPDLTQHDTPPPPQKKETVSTTVVEALPDPTQHDTPPTEIGFWTALQEQVARQRPALAAFLGPGQIVTQSDTKLVIALDNDFCRSNLLEPDNLAVIRDAAQALLEKPIQVIIEPLASATNGSKGVLGETPAVQNPSVSEETQQRTKEFKQAVIDIFDATPT